MDLLKSIMKRAGLRKDTEDEYEKEPTSARHWTDANRRPASARELRRRREADAKSASRKYYRRQRRTARLNRREDEANAVGLLSRYEKTLGHSWREEHPYASDQLGAAPLVLEVVSALDLTESVVQDAGRVALDRYEQAMTDVLEPGDLSNFGAAPPMDAGANTVLGARR